MAELVEFAWLAELASTQSAGADAGRTAGQETGATWRLAWPAREDAGGV